MAVAAVIKLSSVPLNINGVRFFSGCANPDLFFQMKEMAKFMCPKLIVTGVFFAEGRYFKPPETDVVAGSCTPNGIQGNLKPNIVWPIKEVKFGKRRPFVRRVKDNRQQFTDEIFKRRGISGIPSSFFHGRLEVLAVLDDDGEVNGVGWPAVAHGDVERNAVWFYNQAKDANERGDGNVRQEAVEQQ